MRNLLLSPIFILLIGGVAISFSPIIVRLIELDPISIGFYRIFLALPLFLLVFLKKKKIKQEREINHIKVYGIVILSGVFFALDLICWHWSIKLTSVAKSTLFSNFAPIFIVIFSIIFFQEKFSRNFFLTLAGAILGMIMLLGESYQFNISDFYGDLLGLLTAVWYGSYILTVSRLRFYMNSSKIMLLSGIVTCFILAFVSVMFEESYIPTTYYSFGLLLCLAIICQFIGQAFITYSLAFVSASISSLLLLIQPLCAAVWGYVFFQEYISHIQLIGGLLILTSIYYARIIHSS